MLNFKKKKLKELSNSKVIFSSTDFIVGGADTDKPSQTSTHARCAIQAHVIKKK